MEPDRAPVPQARINEMIRAPKVRLVDDDGSQIGVKDTNEAREYACSTDRQTHRAFEPQHGSLQRELEHGFAGIVADEMVGEHRGSAIESAALRDAQMPPAEAARILHRGQQAR